MNDEDSDKLRAAFIAVIETGSFAAAARVLGRDASVLSRRIAALEAHLRIRLLERSTRRVSATEAGRAFYTKIRQAADLIDEAEDEARTQGSSPSGLLRVTAPATFGRRWIAPLLDDFMARYPALQLETSFSDRYVDIIGEQFDVAIRIGAMRDSGVFSRKLADTRRLLCASPAYLASVGALEQPEHLSRVDCLMFTPMSTHPVWHFEDGRHSRSLRVKGPLASDDIETLIAAAVAGRGITMAADWLVHRQLEEGSLIEVLPAWHATGEDGVFLLRPSRQHESAKVRVFSDWLVQNFAEWPWKIKTPLSRG
jgi:DNA-binding transcriptional LysR family regulator